MYLLVMGGLALLTTIARTIGRLPRERASRLDRQRATARPALRPRDLTKLEREVGLSTETAFDVHYRLRPTLRRIAAARLRSRGVDLDSPEGRAEELLGPEAWELAHSDRARPRHHDAAGATLERIEAAVTALEQL